MLVSPLLLTANETTTSADLTLASHYQWRGVIFNKQGVLQADISQEHKINNQSYYYGVWGNLDLDDEYDEKYNFTEVDLYGGFSHTFNDIITLSLGVIKYHFPQETGSGSFDTTEIYASAKLNTLFNPSLTIYKDIEDAHGNATYTNFNLNHTFYHNDFYTSISGNLGYSSSGFSRYLYGSMGSGFSNVDTTLSVGYNVTDKFSIEPFITYVSLLNNAKDANPQQDDNIIGGIKLNYTF